MALTLTPMLLQLSPLCIGRFAQLKRAWSIVPEVGGETSLFGFTFNKSPQG
jgi:hypothetical protein